MAFADIGTATSRLSARVGRQELAYGDQRLVGHVSWPNTARTFDAVRGTVRTPGLQVDSFAASVVRILDDEFDKSGNGNRFFGAYGTTPQLDAAGSVEPYVFVRSDRNIDSEARRHGRPDARRPSARGWAGKAAGAPRLRGRDGGRRPARSGPTPIRAWAGHWQVRETLPGAPSVQADRRIQRRLRRRGSHRRQARHVRSALSDAATTSTASPIRSAGATSATCAPASSCRRSWKMQIDRATTTRGG